MIEILPHLTQISLVYGDLENKELELVKSRIVIGRDPGLITKTLKHFGKLGRHRIILALDSKIASTLYSSVVLVRDNPRDPIDESDLDNLLSQAVWKFFDRQRAKIAAKIGVNDFDVLLADVRIGNIKLDGHRVVNPLGFRAHSVEVQLNQTFTTRQALNDFKKVLPVGSVSFITEAGTAWSHLVSRIHKDELFAVANIFPGQTSLFIGEGFRLGHHADLSWGENNLLGIISETLKISPATARAVIGRYLEKNTSPNFEKKLEGFLMEELSDWAGQVNGAFSNRAVGVLYLNTCFEMPRPVFAPNFRSKFRSAVKVLPLNEEFLNEHYQFKFKYSKGIDRQSGFSTLAAVLEATFLPQYDKMSQMAKKRVRWLSLI